MSPGEVVFGQPSVRLFGRARPILAHRLHVENTGDRPGTGRLPFSLRRNQPGTALRPGRRRGHRLAIAAGTSVRFEPGIALDVELVPFAGARYVAGFRGEVKGPLDG